MVDNFDLIKKYLKWEHPDHFYFIQIIQRKKDPGNEEMEKTEKVIKSYYVNSPEYFDGKIEEIKTLCKAFNARAYINLPRRTSKGVALACLVELSKIIESGEYTEARNCYTKACGKVQAMEENRPVDKFRLVDVDENHLKDLEEIKKIVGEAIKFEVPTVSGIHLICGVFDTKLLKDKFYDIDVHRNSPTLLFYGN